MGKGKVITSKQAMTMFSSPWSILVDDYETTSAATVGSFWVGAAVAVAGAKKAEEGSGIGERRREARRGRGGRQGEAGIIRLQSCRRHLVATVPAFRGRVGPRPILPPLPLSPAQSTHAALSFVAPPPPPPPPPRAPAPHRIAPATHHSTTTNNNSKITRGCSSAGAGAGARRPR
uniref:Uncharacterized protein n=1 Tax=Oryza glumipatula TaxID=40148 RepID=A0A0D9YGB3_9ORYZ